MLETKDVNQHTLLMYCCNGSIITMVCKIYPPEEEILKIDIETNYLSFYFVTTKGRVKKDQQIILFLGGGEGSSNMDNMQSGQNFF